MSLINGISVLIKKVEGSFLASCTMPVHTEGAILGGKSKPLSDTESTGALTLGFPASRTMSNKFLFLLLAHLRCLVIEAQMDYDRRGVAATLGTQGEAGRHRRILKESDKS